MREGETESDCVCGSGEVMRDGTENIPLILL